MLIDRRSWPSHRPWVFGAIVVFGAATLWYVLTGLRAGHLPDGTSYPGFFCGAVAGGIILFEFLLWPRKWLRAWRLGRTQTWMRAHIWLGLLSVPLIVLHSGFRFGGSLSTWLTLLFFIVIGSGLFGLLLQQYLPQKMLTEISGETIYSQIERRSEQLHQEAEDLVSATCGPTEEEAFAEATHSNESDQGNYILIGAVRVVGRVQGRVHGTRVPPAPVPQTHYLRQFHHEYIAPYLRHGSTSGSPLCAANHAAGMFRDLRVRINPAAHDAVTALEALCDQRRQFDRQIRLHWWLHSWLGVHVPLSVALVMLMIAHVWYAVKYW